MLIYLWTGLFLFEFLPFRLKIKQEACKKPNSAQTLPYACFHAFLFSFVVFRFHALTLPEILQLNMLKHKTSLIKCFWSFSSKPL